MPAAEETVKNGPVIDSASARFDHARMLKPLLLAFALLLVTASPVTHARQDAAPAPAASSPDVALDTLQQQLDDLKQAAGDKASRDALADLRGKALAIQDQAAQLATSLQPQQQSVQSQLGVLGPPPVKGAPAEVADVRRQRRELDKAKSTVDAQIKRAQLLAQAALQAAAQMSDQRRNDFQARLASRTNTPFSRAFWGGTAQSLPGDIRRLRSLGRDARSAVTNAWQPPNRTPLLACLIAAGLMLGVVRVLLERVVLRFSTRRMPPGHLRRSALAAAIAAMTVLTTGLAAWLVFLGLSWNGQLGSDLSALGRRLVWLVVLSAYIAGLGRALLSVRRPSWRLPNLSNREAKSLQPFPWLIAVAVLLLGLVERLNSAIGASLPASVAVRGFIAVLLAILIGVALVRLGRARRVPDQEGQAPTKRPVWLALLLTCAIAAVIGAVLAVAVGYIALGFYLAAITLWVGVWVCSIYLLMHLISDMFTLLLSPRSRNGQRLQKNFDLAPGTLEQARTILTGLTRTLFVLFAITRVLAQVTASPSDVFSSLTVALGVLKLGHVALSVGDVVNAVLVVVIGLVLLRMFKRWLIDELLPQTTLEPGMQSSVVTLLGYIGVIAVFVLALAALQVSLQNITWIASALSVGIGFGLQAIVQNFISGLILLAERPVKVGDWVSLNGVEGDIRRINVRATEIQLWDRSTMIVPNSQLITENVRNVTLSKALGRVYFLLPMPLDTDAERVRQIMLDALHEHAAVLDDPVPTVRLDSVDTGAMHFSVIGYLHSPRDVVGTRSDLLLTILKRLREARVRMIRPQEMQLQRAAVAGMPEQGDAVPARSTSSLGSRDQD